MHKKTRHANTTPHAVLSSRQVAKIVGLTQGAVLKIERRAFKKLREQLAPLAIDLGIITKESA